MARSRLKVLAAAVLVAAGLLVVPSGAGATTSNPNGGTVPHEPGLDPFYGYDGTAQLSTFAPGAVLKTRTGVAHIESIPTPVRMTQLLYRTTDQLGGPTQTVVSVLRPPVQTGPVKVISYQSFYDSLTQRCQPSWVLNGGKDQGTYVIEEAAMAGYLLQGYTIVTSDFEGQDPVFGNGPSAGRATLDGIRAAFASPAVGLPAKAKVALLGYSGGAIGTDWAAELAPTYAPDVNARLVGAAMGGLLVDPIHNLHYIDGSRYWTGVLPMALMGIANAFGIDIDPYLSDYGRMVVTDLEDACILDANGHYPGLTFAKLVKPQYADPLSIPPVRAVVDKIVMGTGGRPTVPLMIRQGLGGPGEGTRPSAVYGKGDGVMIAGDVRTLARQYCAEGLKVDYAEGPLSHSPTGITSILEASPWIADRFAGTTAPSDCASIKPGNSIAPIGSQP